VLFEDPTERRPGNHPSIQKEDDGGAGQQSKPDAPWQQGLIIEFTTQWRDENTGLKKRQGDLQEDHQITQHPPGESSTTEG